MLELCKSCIVWTPFAILFDSLLYSLLWDWVYPAVLWMAAQAALICTLFLYLMPHFSFSLYSLKTAQHVTDTTNSKRFVLKYVTFLGLMNYCNCLLFHCVCLEKEQLETHYIYLCVLFSLSFLPQNSDHERRWIL